MIEWIKNPNFAGVFAAFPHPLFSPGSDDWSLHVQSVSYQGQLTLGLESRPDAPSPSVLHVDTGGYARDWVRLVYKLDADALPFGGTAVFRFDMACASSLEPIQWIGIVRTCPGMTDKKYETVMRLKLHGSASPRWRTFERRRDLPERVDGCEYFFVISIAPGVSDLYLCNVHASPQAAETDRPAPQPAPVPIPVERVDTGVSVSLLPPQPVSPGREKLGVLTWSVSHNPLGRAWVLADMLGDRYDVEIAGPAVQAWGGGIWEPVAQSARHPIHAFRGDSFAAFVDQSLSFVKAHPYDVVVASKARFPSLFMALLYKLVWKSAVVIDLDDYEIAFHDDGRAIDLDDLSALLDAAAPEPAHGTAWTRFAETMLDLADSVTVASEPLQARYGGVLVPHARDEAVFDPKLYDRDGTRAKLGFAPSDKVVVFLGTPRVHKGLTEIAAALDAMDDPDVVFCIIGRVRDAALRDALSRFARLRIVTLDDQPIGRAAELVNCADAVCVWQDDQSRITDYQFPAKLVDAIAMGVPVVVRPVAPLSDLIAQDAVIVAADSNLKDTLAAVLSDPALRRRCGAQARDVFLAGYGYGAVRPNLHDTVTKAMSDRRPVPERYAELLALVRRHLPAGFRADEFKELEAAVDRGGKAPSNLILNPNLRRWSGDIGRIIATRFDETADGWYADYRAGTAPVVETGLAEVTHIGARERTYGLRVNIVDHPSDSYVRVMTRIDGRRLAAGQYWFGCGFNAPAVGQAAGVREVFIGRMSGKGNRRTVEKLASLRRRIMVAHRQQVRNVPVTITPEMAAQAAGGDLVLVFDFDGTGEIVIFEPYLTQARRMPALRAPAADFEDGNIRSQVERLHLSPLWRSREAVSQFSLAPVRKVRARAPEPTPFVQIVVPVFNAAADVEDCVRSILANTSSPFEIILSDDGSDAYTAARLREMAQSDPRVRLHVNEQNLGYTRNINQALQQTVADYLVLLNSDVIVSQGWLDKLYATITTTADTAAAGPLSNAASWQSVPATKSGNDWAVNTLPGGVSVADMAALVDTLSDASRPAFPLLNGFCTMFRKRVLEEAGWFADDAFPMGYGEENDLCLRITQLGYKLRVADDCYIYHKKSRSFGNERRRELSKKANVILRRRHPQVNFAKLEGSMRDSGPLNALRERLTESSHVELEARQVATPPADFGHLTVVGNS